MKNEEQILKEYSDMMNDVMDEYGVFSPENKINCYVCDKCSYITKTISIDCGEIPTVYNCNSCDSLAQSTSYKDVAPELKPTHEWYRPSFDECLSFKENEEMIEHILMGGLNVRQIK